MFLKNLIIASCLFAAIALTCTGCVKMHNGDPEEGYSTVFPLTPIEYNIFLTKQIGVLENVLSTRFSMANSVAAGTYDIEKELTSAEEALSKIQSIKDEVTVTMPPENYESDRQNALDLTEDARLAVSDYVDALKANDKKKIKELAVTMKNCYVAISGEANSYYQ